MTELLDVVKARTELRKSTMIEIERATALTWGARAAASYQLSLAADELPTRFRHFYEGENYRQEAFEHSSMVEDRGLLLGEIHDEVESVREQAMYRLENLEAGAGRGRSSRPSPTAKPARGKPKRTVSLGK